MCVRKHAITNELTVFAEGITDDGLDTLLLHANLSRSVIDADSLV